MNFTDRIILTAYRCIKEDNFDCKLQTLPHLIAFVANSIGGVFVRFNSLASWLLLDAFIDNVLYLL